MTISAETRAGLATDFRGPGILLNGCTAGLLLLFFLTVLPLEAAAQPLPARDTAAQEGDTGEPIFRRFALTRKTRKTAQRIFEFPVSLHPQSDPNAEINKNLGFNYVSSGRPDNRWYVSSSVGFSKMEWEPSDPNVDLVKVRTFNFSFLINRLFSAWLVTSFGLGLGVMDGFVVNSGPDNYSERLEPFIPVHFGLAARLGDSLQLGLKVTHFPFFRQQPTIAPTRVLLGIGYSY